MTSVISNFYLSVKHTYIFSSLFSLSLSQNTDMTVHIKQKDETELKRRKKKKKKKKKNKNNNNNNNNNERRARTASQCLRPSRSQSVEVGESVVRPPRGVHVPAEAAQHRPHTPHVRTPLTLA